MSFQMENILKKESRKHAARQITASEPLSGTVPWISSGRLLAGHKEIIIEHDGGEYRLRETKQGKLILAK